MPGAVLGEGLRPFLADERGSILPLAAVGVLASIAAAALAVDLTRAYAVRHELRTIADAAALAAAARLPDTAAARRAALAYAEKNRSGAIPDGAVTGEDVEFGTWEPRTRSLRPAGDGLGADAVRVTARLSAADGNALPTFLARVFGVDTVDLSGRATAGRRAPACILALDPDARGAMRLDSNASVTAQACTVQVNSVDTKALEVKSNGVLTAASVCVGGDYASKNVVSPTPTVRCPPSPDPLAGLAPVEVGGCRYSNAKHADAKRTLSPGVYCQGLEIDGDSDITLSPGTYVVKDGPLRVLGNSRVGGDGVTFYLTGKKAQLFFDSNSTLRLTAPTSGPLAGILVYQDRVFGGEHRWNSSKPVDLTGTIYLPAGVLSSQSPAAMTPLNSCNVLIANRLDFNANSGVSIDLNSPGCRQALPRAVLGAIVLYE